MRAGKYLSEWVQNSNHRYAAYYWPDSGHYEIWSFMKPVYNKVTKKVNYIRVDYPYHLLKPGLDSDDRPMVILYIAPNITQKWRIHRLIYSHFIGSIPDGMVVRHFNDNGLDLRPGNLKLGTVADNNQDAVRNNRMFKGKSRLTLQQARSIRNLYYSGQKTQPELAVMFGRSRRHIRRIISGHHFKES
jgi:hypothetical protein